MTQTDHEILSITFHYNYYKMHISLFLITIAICMDMAFLQCVFGGVPEEVNWDLPLTSRLDHRFMEMAFSVHSL